ncbi:hypothetical protein EJD97_002516 [Solanum chilense]|uniref:CCHC-type domain-containing protein n=1 Tax=Solanum chilense TaxID=4083 RepID=A0A6N2CDI8_SOLCI|nr:hypothetical protein EJD97_002516 [Solanum chilense]
MNTRRNVDRGIGEAAARGNQVPPQAPTAEMEMLIGPAGLTDGEAMTAQAEQKCVPKKNPPASIMIVNVHQVEESINRKHTRAGNRSRQAEENFSRNISTKIRDKPRFKKGLSNQGESSSSKGRYDRNSKSRVKRKNDVDTPQERPHCRKCGKLHGGECMMGKNACCSCGKPGYMVKDCLNKRSQEQGKDRVQPNGTSEEAPRRQRFFALKSRGAEEGTFGDLSGA